MRILRALFGPSQKEIWKQLSRKVGGRFHEGGLFATSAVQARHRDWIITLDTYTVSSGNSHQTFTRLRAPYFNPEGFRFEIYRSSIFSGLGKSLGMQDIRVGHRRFDEDFVIKGNESGRVRRLFDNEKIRRLINAQPRIRLSVKAHEGWLSKFPAGVDELHFQSAGVIKDLDQLRALFDLFAEVLQQVCHEGRAYEDDVRIHMRRLRAPGGRIEDKHILWESYGQRRDAAAALGRLGDPAAVPVLASVLWDEDAVLRTRAVEGAHRDPAPRFDRPADPPARRRACCRGPEHARTRGGRAERAGRRGAGRRRARGVSPATSGRSRRSATVTGPRSWRPLRARSKDPRARTRRTRWRGFTAVEALPRLREVLRNIGAGGPTGEAVAAAVRKLEARASLPRAASGADVQADTLPRAARQPGDDPATLPARLGGRRNSRARGARWRRATANASSRAVGNGGGYLGRVRRDNPFPHHPACHETVFLFAPRRPNLPSCRRRRPCRWAWQWPPRPHRRPLRPNKTSPRPPIPPMWSPSTRS